MYREFILKQTEKGIIAGYSWPLDDPKRVVCIVHGIGEYGGRYDRVAEKFRKEGIATIAIDLRGHGRSVNAKGHCAPQEAVLDDISEMLVCATKQYPGKEIVLYGHSMGGNITLNYRAKGAFNDMPVKYLISAPWIRIMKPVPDPLYKMITLLSKVAPSLTIGSSVDESLLGNPASVKPYNDNPMVHNRISLQCAVEQFKVGKELEAGTNEDNGNAADIPTLILHGTADRICSIEGTRKAYEHLKAKGNNVEMVELEGLFHEIHNGNDSTNGDEVIERMIRFILE